MTIFWLSLALAVVANLVYHVSQKSIPAGVHPLISLCASYVVALVATLCLFPFFPVRPPVSQALRQLRWPSFALGLAIVGVELGFLIAYRVGWRLSLGSTAGAAALAVLLIPTGVLFYGERLSAGNVTGIVLCIAGLALIVQK